MTAVFLAIGFLSVAYAEDADISAFDREIRSRSGALDSIRNELERGRAKLKVLQKEEGNYLERLEQIEKNISASRTYLNVMEQRIDSVGQVIVALQDSLVTAEKLLEKRQTAMKKRLRQAYMSGSLILCS